MVFVNKTLSYFRHLIGLSECQRNMPRSGRQTAKLHCAAEVLEERILLSAVALELVQEVLGGQLGGSGGTPAVLNDQVSNVAQQVAAELGSLANTSPGRLTAAIQQLRGPLVAALTANTNPTAQAALMQTLGNIQQTLGGGIGAAIGQFDPTAQVQQSLLDASNKLAPLFDSVDDAIVTKLNRVNDILNILGSGINNLGTAGNVTDSIFAALGNLPQLDTLQDQLDTVADHIETAIENSIETARPGEGLNRISALLDDLGDSLSDWPQPRSILQAELDQIFGHREELDEILFGTP